MLLSSTLVLWACMHAARCMTACPQHQVHTKCMRTNARTPHACQLHACHRCCGRADRDKDAEPRPAVVTVMGHVDHGKAWAHHAAVLQHLVAPARNLIEVGWKQGSENRNPHRSCMMRAGWPVLLRDELEALRR